MTRTDVVLLLIDLQAGFDDRSWGPRNNPRLESKIAQLLGFWRSSQRPVIHVRHDSRAPGSPLYPGQPGNDFKPCAQPVPGEPTVSKSVHAAFIGTDLTERLQGMAAREVVFAGLTTDHCVSTSARMASDLGFTTTVVTDATATFARRDRDGSLIDADSVHRISLASLDGEFARLVTVADLIGSP